jgi:hypothetical protein
MNLSKASGTSFEVRNMPEKCYPCPRSNLLPMYLDYTGTQSNKGMQRTRTQHVSYARQVSGGGSCAPLMPGVRQLLVMNLPNRLNLLSLVLLALLGTGSCSKESSPREEPPVQASLCDLYKNPAKYEGKRIILSATITQLPSGKYLYPIPSCEGNFSFIKFDGDKIQNSGLSELETSNGSSQGRREFDIEVTGVFDSKYVGEFDGFRYRVIPLEIKQKSPVRIGKPLGAAEQSLAGDGAIACFSSSLFHSARMLIARRS